MNIISPTLMKILTSRSVICGSDHKEGRCYCNLLQHLQLLWPPVVEEATEADIKVVSFDNVVDTDEQVATVGIDETEFGRIGAEWLAEKLDGKGQDII